ncbi:MAG TPA: hypothetical protein QGI22_01205 [Candidatus Woesearchaeota archaeon]|jgi:L-asparagine transporter-like permease|nr:hypothetical protein [Candidatus Woesearchaeota archaeon]HJN56562.1 hypothetical protein [Candidatus Woesearchaeota archaeon]|tara:strand:+ start:47798 stop:48100 length:303 start_codon:yes stop_codon:yes gene_type:complete
MVTEKEKENTIKEYYDETERDTGDNIGKFIDKNEKVAERSIKARNKRKIIIYLSLALIFIIIGMYNNNDLRWYILAVVLIILVLFRKYWLMKRLKKLPLK